MSGSEQINENGQEPLVDFALRVYAEPKVEELCLYLQNDYNANVNILLWCCWLEAREIQLSTRWLDDVLISIDTLSQLTVGRLQEVRRAIKTSLGFTKVQAKLINKHVLNAELMAEKIFLQRLQDMTSRFDEFQKLSNETPEEMLSAEYYLSFLQIPRAKERSEALMAYAYSADVFRLPQV